MMREDGFSKGFKGDDEAMAPGGDALPEGEAAAGAGAIAPAEGADTMSNTSGSAGEDTLAIAVVSPEGNPDEGLHGEQPTGGEGQGTGTATEEFTEGEPAMTQAEKSWNGRLNARDTELKARAEELAEREKAVAAREAVLPMDYQEAVAFIADNYGEELVSAIAGIAIGASKGAASESSAELVGKIDGLLADVRSGFNAVHEEMISSVHEDFMDIAQSDQFKTYIDGLPEEERAAAMQVIQEGSPRQVIRLLTTFKTALQSQGAGQGQGEKYDTEALDAAAGVRSTGGRTPGLSGDAIAAGGEIDRFRAGFNAS